MVKKGEHFLSEASGKFFGVEKYIWQWIGQLAVQEVLHLHICSHSAVAQSTDMAAVLYCEWIPKSCRNFSREFIRTYVLKIKLIRTDYPKSIWNTSHASLLMRNKLMSDGVSTEDNLFPFKILAWVNSRIPNERSTCGLTLVNHLFEALRTHVMVAFSIGRKSIQRCPITTFLTFALSSLQHPLDLPRVTHQYVFLLAPEWTVVG